VITHRCFFSDSASLSFLLSGATEHRRDCWHKWQTWPQLCSSPGYRSRRKRPPRATASGRLAEDIRNDELTARQRAIRLRLAGQPVKQIGSGLGRTEAWFHKWWRRYRESGPEGLYDLTRAQDPIAQRISPELERRIVSLRRRRQAHATPATRYRLLGVTAIHAELQSLGIHPLPCERTLARVLERNGLTAPRVRLAPLLPRQEYPGPQARASNELHEIDRVGPIYLQGRRHRSYLWICKDVFDGAVCLRLASSRRMDEVRWFLGECGKDLGRPEQVQLDNARELAGWGPAARTLSRVIRLCLR
jgi:transposase-like protein